VERQVKLSVLMVLLVFSMVSLSLFVPSAYSLTFLEGHITEDTTLTTANGPYRVINDVTVDPYVMLTVEPGVNVQFADGFSLIILGNLNITGANSDPAIFTSSRSIPSAGAWNSIEFRGAEMSVRNAKIMYAVNGLTIEGQGLATIRDSEIESCSESGVLINDANNVHIEGNTIRQNKNGIMLGASDIHKDVEILRNNIYSNSVNGVSLPSTSRYLANASFSYNTIGSNGENGVYLNAIAYSGPISGTVPSSIESTLFSFNSISSNGKNGIYLFTYYISNVTFASNTVTQNTQNGIFVNAYATNYYGRTSTTMSQGNFSSNIVTANGQNGICLYAYAHGSEGGTAHITNMSFSSNTVESNGQRGISLQATAEGGGYAEEPVISDVTFSSNIISINGEDGIHLQTTGKWSMISNTIFSSNRISTNTKNGIYVYGRSSGTADFDIILSRNVIESNKENGILVSALASGHDVLLVGGARLNVTGNVVSHNSYGLAFQTAHHLAFHNDIYSNTHGINVSNDATVKAEYNYWGDSTGPSHSSLNPEGKGNPVNGNGVNLDFIPWLTAPVNPRLFASVAINPASIISGGKVNVTVHVTNGTNIIQGVSVQFVSDKGGTFSPISGSTNSTGDFATSFTSPTVSEQTNVRITATVSITGYLDDSDYKYVSVLPQSTLSLYVGIESNPSVVQSSQTSTITVQVEVDTSPVADATVALSSSGGGTLSATGGSTDSNGYFTTSFTAPTVTTQTIITITAAATKAGCVGGQRQTQVTVNPSQPQSDLTLWIYIGIAAVILVAIGGGIAFARRKSSRNKL
jgi:parallel beta-helix repeat protein